MAQDLPLPRALTAEALGTALLVAVVIGSAQMAADLQAAPALLLANAAATAGALFALITILAPLSDAQFNPLVSLVLCLTGRQRWSRLAPLVAAQAAGALAGAALAHAMFALPLYAPSAIPRDGTPRLIAEAVAAFSLILVIFGAEAARANTAALVAAWIAAAYWFTSSTSFANPAMLLARALTAAPAGIRPMDTPGFLAAELVGGLMAAALSTWLFRRP